MEIVLISRAEAAVQRPENGIPEYSFLPVLGPPTILLV
jgi:hypothetical protein